jgi:CHASE2 domain-containing sensor protein
MKALFNPFPGLRPFEAHESHLFFGRDGQSDELLTRLRRSRFLAVVGTSGSGKSSLVRSGLLPGLYGGLMAQAGSRWRIAVFRPGSQPISNLASALNAPEVFGRQQQIQQTFTETVLRRSAVGLIEAAQEARMPARDNLLVVVDQFEELFRFKRVSPSLERDDEAAAFVKLLLEATKQHKAPIYAVLTMRSDFLGDCAQFRDLPEAINDGQYLIPRLTRDQHREAITGPAAIGGGALTPRLLNRLLNDAGDDPDQLPIFQHALMRTWDYWAATSKDGEPLDINHYEKIGGMEQALNRHAGEALAELALNQPPETGKRRQQIAKKLFQAITEIEANGKEIRRPTQLDGLAKIAGASATEVGAVIETFRQPGRSFLTPKHGVPLEEKSWIDISHESLIRKWEVLREWVNEEMVSARLYKRLAETAALHQEKKHGYLRDPELQINLAWQKEQQPTRVWAERYHGQFDAAIRFLKASLRRVRFFMAAGILVVTLAVYFLFKMNLLAKLDSAIQGYLLKPHPDLVMVMIDDGSAAALHLAPLIESNRIAFRQYHAQLVDLLSQKGARVIGFDICFVDSSSYDVAFNQAIATAQARGTAVVFAVDCEDDYEPTPSLAAVGEAYGSAKYFDTGNDIAIRIFSENDELPPLALKILYPGQADSGAVANLLQDGSSLYVSFLQPGDSLKNYSYYDVLQGWEPPGGWAGKIVLIGYKVPPEFYIPQNMEEGRYGLEVHANAVNNLLQVPLKGIRWHLAIGLLIMALNVLLFRRFGEKMIDPALLIVIESGLFFGMVVVLYRATFVLLPIAVSIVAIVWSIQVTVFLIKAKLFPRGL